MRHWSESGMRRQATAVPWSQSTHPCRWEPAVWWCPAQAATLTQSLHALQVDSTSKYWPKGWQDAKTFMDQVQKGNSYVQKTVIVLTCVCATCALKARAVRSPACVHVQVYQPHSFTSFRRHFPYHTNQCVPHTQPRAQRSAVG